MEDRKSMSFLEAWADCPGPYGWIMPCLHSLVFERLGYVIHSHFWLVSYVGVKYCDGKRVLASKLAT
jgi:hypothetical protein